MFAKHLMFWQKMTQAVRSWMDGRPEKSEDVLLPIYLPNIRVNNASLAAKRHLFICKRRLLLCPTASQDEALTIRQGHGRTRCGSSPSKDMMDVPSLAETTSASAGPGRLSRRVVLSCLETRCRLFALWHGKFICQPWRGFTFAQI